MSEPPPGSVLITNSMGRVGATAWVSPSAGWAAPRRGAPGVQALRTNQIAREPATSRLRIAGLLDAESRAWRGIRGRPESVGYDQVTQSCAGSLTPEDGLW